MGKVAKAYSKFTISDQDLDGLSRRELAKMCGVNPYSVNHWLNKGISFPYPEELKILNELKIDSNKNLPLVVCEAFYNYYVAKGLKKFVKTKTEGNVYFIESESCLKVGYSTDVKQRVKALQRWPGEFNIVGIYPGNYNDEQKIHLLCKEYLINNSREYYQKEFRKDILRIIGEVIKNDNLALTF